MAIIHKLKQTLARKKFILDPHSNQYILVLQNILIFMLNLCVPIKLLHSRVIILEVSHVKYIHVRLELLFNPSTFSIPHIH